MAINSKVLAGTKIALVLAMMALIFAASHSTQSFEHSSRILLPLLKLIWPGITAAEAWKYIIIVRKVAHITEFAVLALLLYWTMHQRGAPWCWRTGVISFCLATVYAMSDEFHQSFVPNRQGSAWDVLIDTGGVLLGLGFVHLCFKVAQWRRRSSLNPGWQADRTRVA